MYVEQLDIMPTELDVYIDFVFRNATYAAQHWQDFMVTLFYILGVWLVLRTAAQVFFVLWEGPLNDAAKTDPSAWRAKRGSDGLHSSGRRTSPAKSDRQ